jgi:2-oxoglutarate dehydrogenase E1 component
MNGRDSAIDAIRRWGYLRAHLDPLGRLKPRSNSDIEEAVAVVDEVIRRAYCGSIGAEFMHLSDPERRRWIQDRVEAEPAEVDRKRIVELLIRASVFEAILQKRYIGTKRYSVEGASALIPLLDGILDRAGDRGAERVLLAMAHRGRLNVMAHLLQTPIRNIFAEFEDVDPQSTLGGGDLQYHKGATGVFTTRAGREVAISMVSNPSHLEAVNPIAMGRTRAWQDRLGERARERALLVNLHGDAAFAGQGIVAETLNLAELEGYEVGGTVHVNVNNLIGFTTEPESLHTSPFSTDIAKRNEVPIFHVNGEDPEAVVRVGRIALEFRNTFQSDAVVDLICYRRYGHSEVDDPSITQPRLYAQIAKRPDLWRVYANQTGMDLRVLEKLAEQIATEYTQAHEEATKMKVSPSLYSLPKHWEGFAGGHYHHSLEVDTAVPDDRLREIALKLTRWPERFAIHPKVRRVMEARRAMGTGERPVDWGMGEMLAYGSLLWDGVPVRLSGEDTRRGTFNHRHSMLIDVETEEDYCPLSNLHPDQASFFVYDSPLSEAATVGFEYGYSRDYPEALVLWEAQFGDFVNGAQVILDQFVCAGEDKWGLLSGLVLLLPHGYEGQGPEHSSARLERFLQLAAEDNIQVCQPSTSAQLFHLLRRQALRKWRKPLVVFTPKGMLRDPASASPLDDFSQGRFLRVRSSGPISAKIVLICTGKICHELEREREQREDTSAAVITLEELYPFPESELADEIARHPSAQLIWVQEEPANMGAMFYVLPYLERLAGQRPVWTVKRSPSASPATGSKKAHQIEQRTLISMAFYAREDTSVSEGDLRLVSQ